MSRARAIPPAREVKDGDGDVGRPTADVVNEIASELNLLSESRVNPHAFFERRDMLVRRLRRLAKRLSAASAPRLSLAERRTKMAAAVALHPRRSDA